MRKTRRENFFTTRRTGEPYINPAKLDPKQYVGQWTGIDPNSAEGKMNQIVTAISKLPKTQSIPIGRNNWVVTLTLGQSNTLEYNKPAVVLTYVGPTPPLYSTVQYKNASKAKGTKKVFIAFFDWGSDEVSPEAANNILRQVAKAWAVGSGSTIQVIGYADRSGSPRFNQELSELRVKSVIDALSKMGIPVGKMVASGRGENDNRVPTESGSREPQNRRVEIIFDQQ